MSSVSSRAPTSKSSSYDITLVVASGGKTGLRTNELPESWFHDRVFPSFVAKAQVGHSSATVRLNGLTATSMALSSPRSRSAGDTLGGIRTALDVATSAERPKLRTCILKQVQEGK